MTYHLSLLYLPPFGEKNRMVKPFFATRYHSSYHSSYQSIYQSEKTFFDVENSIDRAICNKKE